MSLTFSNAPSPKLERINSNVFVSVHDSGLRVDRQSPSVIILFAWFNANISQAKKYIAPLKAVYPTATVILVTLDLSWAYSEARREETVEPVAEILERARDAESNAGFRGILLHILSNGGGMQLIMLSKVMARRFRASCVQPVSCPIALVLDSVPDDNDRRSLVSAFTEQVRNPVLRHSSIPFLHLLCSYIHFSHNGHVQLEVYRLLHSSDILPGFVCRGTRNSAIPRLYVYSKIDQVIPATSVERHIQEARMLGIPVRTEPFEDTPHVMHAKADPGRYWRAVVELWKDAAHRASAKL
ncbi:hypothetical protein NM688_g842 [Phlebia brevispora]|uniref:Uncharacterized protein n=1 Tax=Phlebia brevispora TaxID=194682 RepID=A0ACC1TCZ2_9APHY|nr:hypothetical protein NM688_g842 [Phlebia brevispora]